MSEWTGEDWAGLIFGMLTLTVILAMTVTSYLEIRNANNDPYGKLKAGLRQILSLLPKDTAGRDYVADSTGLGYRVAKDQSGEDLDLFFLSPFMLVNRAKYSECYIYLIESNEDLADILELDVLTYDFLERRLVRVDSGDHYLYDEAIKWTEKVSRLIESECKYVELDRAEVARKELDKIRVE